MFKNAGFIIFGCVLLVNFHEGSAGSFIEDLTLTLKQKHLVDKFRDRVSARLTHAYMSEDVYLMRWLRARNWNLDDAERMLMKALQWREDNKMDTIHDEDWSDMKLDYPMTLDGRDKEGRPVLFVPFGSMDLRQAFVSGNGRRLERYLFKTIDEAANVVRDLGAKYQNISQGVILMNTAGFNLAQHVCLQCAPMVFSFVSTTDTYYPGVAEKIIAVNLPGIAENLVQTGRALMNPNTSKIFHIFGTNRREWRAFLEKYFDDSQLPEELGGTKDLHSSSEWNENETNF